MIRMLALVAALFMSAITVSSAVAGSIEPLRFTLEPSEKAGQVQLTFRRGDQKHVNSWSSDFKASELPGLDAAALSGRAGAPVRFTIARDPGRIDCAGNGSNGMAVGTCTLTPDRAFGDFLVANGTTRPTEEQTFGLVATDVKRELVTALASARYPTPSIDKLMELSAVGITPTYIRELSAQGYRPASLQSLVEFGALKITPAYIGSFARSGYSNLRPDELVQLKALDITAEFIAGFERIGYGRLPVDTLVQLKALDITPEFVRAVQMGGTLPAPDRLVMLKAIGDDIRRR